MVLSIMDSYEVTFGKDRYHLHLSMEDWCRTHIGEGGWSWSSPKTWEGMGDRIWVMHSMFGNTTFAFKHEKHLSMFLLKWS